ncbi:hypothetical protein IT087_03115 [Candidatus Uhrbacteria bacterium]|nr:hypothetical protein [Candidatus Uhrbacteria bacterium]
MTRQVFIFLLVAAGVAGYGYHRGWLEVRLNFEEFAEATGPTRPDEEFVGTGLGATGRGRAYGIFVSLSEFPPDEHGASRNLPGHALLAQRVADAFIGTHIMRRDDAIVLMDEAATVQRFNEAVVRLSLAVGPEDLAIIYFATHGGVNQLELRHGEMLTESMLQADLALLHAGEGLFIADACHSGSLAHATPRPFGTILWNRLFSTGETTFSFGEHLSSAIIHVLPMLGADDSRVTLGDLLAAVQDRMRVSTEPLTDEQRDQMQVNAVGDRDAMLWYARSLPIALDE